MLRRQAAGRFWIRLELERVVAVLGGGRQAGVGDLLLGWLLLALGAVARVGRCKAIARG